MQKKTLFTIGFTKKNARGFFTILKDAGVQKIIDVRLSNVSQLAGFAKRDDLEFFLQKLCDCDYQHFPNLAPTKELLSGYKRKEFDWAEYERRFTALLCQRQIEKLIDVEGLGNSCLLCSEVLADQCHRRLVAEYLVAKYPVVDILHL